MHNNKLEIHFQGQYDHAFSLPSIDEEQVQLLAKALRLPVDLAALLILRDIHSPEEGRDFLYPKFSSLPSPSLMKGMQEAVTLLENALRQEIPVIVVGDYDVDGVTSTALLVNVLREFGFRCSFVHPQRTLHGYGFKYELIEESLNANEKVVILTVDCGISDNDEIKKAKQAGHSVIVTDHHQPPETLPEADAILNPLQPGCNFPYKFLSGVGVAYYLTMGLRGHLKRHNGSDNQPITINLKHYLDLVALGTISDLVPLNGVNRILAKGGFEVFLEGGNSGIACLAKRSGLRPELLSPHDISFTISPKINAAGRLNDATLATNLFVQEEEKNLLRIVDDLIAENDRRREMTTEYYKQARTLAQQCINRGENIIVVHSPEWHIGVIGILASRIAEDFQKPAIALAGEKILKGSARTFNDINIFEILSQCQRFFVHFGGHASAAGISIRQEDLSQFQKDINEIFHEYVPKAKLATPFAIDRVIKLEEIDQRFLDLYTLFEPFGQSNPEPVFLSQGPCFLRNPQGVGRDREHLRFQVCLTDTELTGIGFKLGHLCRDNAPEIYGRLVFSIRNSQFNGLQRMQIILHDFESHA